CKKCWESGHAFWECPQQKEESGPKCYLCNGTGHQSNKCANTAVRRICHGCGDKGHLVSQCAKATCYMCGLTGHISRSCP
ncbi:hypothetical protein FOMPIDRAFT_1088834, partial [Fomitopsis schrenkii]